MASFTDCLCKAGVEGITQVSHTFVKIPFLISFSLLASASNNTSWLWHEKFLEQYSQAQEEGYFRDFLGVPFIHLFVASKKKKRTLVPHHQALIPTWKLCSIHLSYCFLLSSEDFVSVVLVKVVDGKGRGQQRWENRNECILWLICVCFVEEDHAGWIRTLCVPCTPVTDILSSCGSCKKKKKKTASNDGTG